MAVFLYLDRWVSSTSATPPVAGSALPVLARVLGQSPGGWFHAGGQAFRLKCVPVRASRCIASLVTGDFVSHLVSVLLIPCVCHQQNGDTTLSQRLRRNALARAQKTNSSAPSSGAAFAFLGTSAPSGAHRVPSSTHQSADNISFGTDLWTGIATNLSLVTSCASGTLRSLNTS
jgi:hypothetical protein